MSADEDPFMWLEDVTGDKALEWVRARNSKTQTKFEADPNFTKLREDLLAILDSDARIPMVSKVRAIITTTSGAIRKMNADFGGERRWTSIESRNRNGK